MHPRKSVLIGVNCIVNIRIDTANAAARSPSPSILHRLPHPSATAVYRSGRCGIKNVTTNGLKYISSVLLNAEIAGIRKCPNKPHYDLVAYILLGRSQEIQELIRLVLACEAFTSAQAFASAPEIEITRHSSTSFFEKYSEFHYIFLIHRQIFSRPPQRNAKFLLTLRRNFKLRHHLNRSIQCIK